MTSVTKLNELSKMFKKKKIMKGGNMQQDDNNTISSTKTVETRNTLDDLLKNIMDVSTCTSNTSNSSYNSEKTNDENNNITSRFTQIVNKETTELSKLAIKIVNIVRYLASPLRLYMKISYVINPVEVTATLHQVKLDNIVKNEIISGWTDADTYGLYILSKVFKNINSLNLLMQDTVAYNKFFNDNDDKKSFDVNSPYCYLFRVVFSGSVRLETIHEKINTYFTNLLNKDDEEVNQVLDMFKTEILIDLQRKLAEELNNFAIVVTQKRVTIKDLNNYEKCYYPQQLYQHIRDIIGITPSAVSINNLLMQWENSDDNVGKMGGKKPKKPKKSKNLKK